MVRQLGVRNRAARAGYGIVLRAGSGDPDWLRADLVNLIFGCGQMENRRNPGTTADLIAAALFVGPVYTTRLI